MKDKVEEFFSEHRSEFDVHEPRPHLWGAVYEELQQQKKARRLRYYAVAASILLVAGIVVMLLQKKHELQTVQQQGTEVAINPEMQEAESYYSSIVQVRRSELDKYSKDYPELCKEFEKEVKNLNLLYAQLKEEYKNSDGSDAVLKAMIENLQAQAQITERQLQIIQSVKEKDSKHKEHV